MTSWNEGARRMFGFTAEEMVGQPILRIIPEELRYEEEGILRTLREGGQVEHRNHAKEEERRTCRGFGHYLADAK